MTRKNSAEPIPGEALERQVSHVLRAFPGAVVLEHAKLAGKDVDVYCTFTDTIHGTVRIAVECKDHARLLTRETIVRILSDYRPIIEQNKADRIMIVTRHGIVASAKDALDGKQYTHVTYDELLQSLFGPGSLIENMQQQFSTDLLSEYYVPVQCYDLDVGFISRNFDRVYNPFIEFARESPSWTFDRLVLEWTKLNSDDMQMCRLAKSYTERELEAMRQLRLRKTKTDLERLVVGWIEDNDIRQGLALLGSYGLGKSSFARRLANVCAQRYARGETDRIPFLIELRHFGSHQDISGLISHELVNRHSVRNGSFETFQLLNRSGRFLIILDGFDEMKQGMTHDSLVFNFNELNKLNVGRSKVILCGRPTLFSSEREQTTVLTGSLGMSDQTVQYIQIDIAPFDTDATISCLKRFAATRPEGEARLLVPKIRVVEKELSHNKDLCALLERPVHIPMLVTVLPRWEGNVTDLTRVAVFRTFINFTISREIQRQRKEFHEYYDIQSRRRFAAELAMLMISSGESRSIRYSDIPEKVIARYQRLGVSFEGTKRDLVRACFLERKPPDILFFPHKSFAEFLVAERITDELTLPSPNSDRLGVRVTDEVFSFIVEINPRSSWASLAKLPLQNSTVLRRLLRAVREGKVSDYPVNLEPLREAVGQSEVFAAWLAVLNDVPPLLAYSFIEHIVKQKHQQNPIAEQVINQLAYHSDDLVAVNAWRAAGIGFTKEFTKFLGKDRLARWHKYHWR
ncbi:MAG: NACHT domain-containing protein [Desulfobulbaceae bacterium]|nr:NACHT domain-containing protein [Desulfobulbaceae bacterium]